MQKRALVFIMTLALSASACLSGPGRRPDRLYPPPPQPLDPDRVSTLTGYVQFVDDRDVSELGGYFELMPGCHIIGTPSHMAAPFPATRSVGTLTTGRWTFALPMSAGHQYQIDVTMPTARTVPLKIKAHETDLGGHKTRDFAQATSRKDIEACFKEAPGSLPAPK
jgi:hypothetical protein